jgi:hypothetical protein
MANWPAALRWSRLVAICALAAFAGPLASTVAARGQVVGTQVYTSNLSHARVSASPTNHLVITMQATGELPGLLTLTFNQDPATGALTTGSWALVVSYAKYLPITQDAPTDDPDAQPLVYVNEGTLGGTFTGATLQIDVSGQVVGLGGARLTVVSGSLQFDGVSGNGSATASALNDVDQTSGSLTLAF